VEKVERREVDQGERLSGGLTAFGQNFDINLGRVAYGGTVLVTCGA
jgi:hypothetical protein